MNFIDQFLQYFEFANCINGVCELIPPSVTYCEAAINGIIARPGYAISNIPYILLGLFIILQSTHRKLKLLGISSIIVGILSFTYDASYTLLAQYLDWNGMFLLIALIIVFNLIRLRSLSNNLSIKLFIILLILHAATVLIFKNLTTIFFALGVIVVIITELLIYKKTMNKYRIRNWVAALTIFFIGWIIWQFDSHKILCDPLNIFNGRAIFHYLTAASIYFLYKHYKEVFNNRWN